MSVGGEVLLGIGEADGLDFALPALGEGAGDLRGVAGGAKDDFDDAYGLSFWYLWEYST
jgi:hypothetical protein